MYSYFTFATVIALTLGAAIHHPGHQAEQVVVHHHDPAVVLHHHVEPLMYVYPLHTSSYMVLQEGTTAHCTLAPSSHDGLVRGLVTLHQHHAGAPVLVNGAIEGLTPGHHGFHLHRDGNTGDSCKAAGPHFNPANVTHGGPMDSRRHAGDFGNIEADINGKSNFNFATYGISLTNGQQDSIIGRAFVVHAKADDLGRGKDTESLKTGNAGGRVACCIVTQDQHH